MTQDNAGKVWFQHGASGLPGYFQFPVHYGNFAAPDQFETDLNIVWGAPILIGDIQAGVPGTRMPDGSLIYATAAAGNEVHRGDRLPKDLIGDYLHGEVVARIVRRLQAGEDRRPDAAPECLPALRVHPLARSGASSGASDGSGFISHRRGPANHSSPAAIARSPAHPHSDLTRDLLFDGTAATAGGVVRRTPGGPFGDSNGRSSLADDLALTILDLERVVTAGDGAVTDSLVNNAG